MFDSFKVKSGPCIVDGDFFCSLDKSFWSGVMPSPKVAFQRASHEKIAGVQKRGFFFSTLVFLPPSPLVLIRLAIIFIYQEQRSVHGITCKDGGGGSIVIYGIESAPANNDRRKADRS